MVDPHLFAACKQARLDIVKTQAEIEGMREAINSFEELVERRLGGLLDQLVALEGEVEGLTEEVYRIREQRLFGEHQMGYLEGAPVPERGRVREYVPNAQPIEEQPPAAEQRKAAGIDAEAELKRLYRRLARVYHPDLALDGGEHQQRTRQMVMINEAYTSGDLAGLRKLAVEGGLEPFGFDFQQPAVTAAMEMTELERLEQRLGALRQQARRLGNHPNLQLSLEVKLARQNGRDLLGEMAKELRRKVSRKMAERDYLRAQVEANR